MQVYRKCSAGGRRGELREEELAESDRNVSHCEMARAPKRRAVERARCRHLVPRSAKREAVGEDRTGSSHWMHANSIVALQVQRLTTWPRQQ